MYFFLDILIKMQVDLKARESSSPMGEAEKLVEDVYTFRKKQ